MEDDDGFFDLEQLLQEEGLIASTVVTPTAWEQNLVRRECADLTEKQRRHIVYRLLELKQANGKLPWGTQSKLAREVGVHKSTICKLFKRIEEQKNRGECIDVSSKRFGRCGVQNQKHPNSEEWLGQVPLNLRGSYRAFAGFLKCSYTHIYRLLKKGLLRAHTSPNKPSVSDGNKIERMKWVLSHIQPATSTQKPCFLDMQHTVHIDEKWFYLNPTTRRLYLLPKEIDPYRSTKSKNYSIKVMFMAITSRPLYSEDGELLHDGKFGIFPFVVKERAKRRSVNRPAGTLETKVITKVTKIVIREMMVNKVIPEIREKWPSQLSKNIIIQQDNARPHLSNNDPHFREAATAEGFNMVLVNQPPQSPDFNVLDLGLFRALQSLQYQTFPQTIDELIERVNEAYADFDPKLIKYVWITLQLVMVEALKVKGGNNYKIPHIGKVRLERLGLLLEQVEVDQAIIDEALAYLNTHAENAPRDSSSTDHDAVTEDMENEMVFYSNHEYDIDGEMQNQDMDINEEGFEIDFEQYEDMEID